MIKGIKAFVRNTPRLHEFAICRHDFMKMRARIRSGGCYSPRTFHINHDKKLIYLSNSKVACSSIKASMYHLEQQQDYRSVHKAANAQKQYEIDVPYDRYADYYKFTFVRNPFARLVSCYVNKLHEDREKLGKTMDRLYFARYLFGYLNVDKGFHNWARRVCRIPDRYADRHFISQSYLVHDKNGNMLVNHVFNFENLARDYGAISEKFDLAPLPHYNKTNKGNWMDYYDLRTARIVYRRYKRDICEFGYQGAYDELIRYIKEKSA
jgi:chondroitin 4-sulfotransferase 11